MLWQPILTVTKRHRLQDDPYEVVVKKGNIVTYWGAGVIWDCLMGLGGGTAYYDNANALIAVGDSNATPTDREVTGLLGTQATTPMLATYPRHIEFLPLPVGLEHLANLIIWRGTFGNADANFHWREAGVLNGNNVLLNRLTGDLGIKASGFWTCDVSVRIL